MKLDNKSILILILLGISIVFGYLWFFKASDVKDQLKDLERANKNIQLERDSLRNENKILVVKFNDIQKDIDERDSRIKEIEYKLSKTKSDLVIANDKANRNQKELEITRNKIKELKKNPIKRGDDDLIKSLKEKLK
jgi:chromosome segregation ATPase